MLRFEDDQKNSNVTAGTVPMALGSSAAWEVCMALVQLMTPGLAFFYGGLVKAPGMAPAVWSICLQNRGIWMVNVSIFFHTWSMWDINHGMAYHASFVVPWIAG